VGWEKILAESKEAFSGNHIATLDLKSEKERYGERREKISRIS
jgi:hypothetical protein